MARGKAKEPTIVPNVRIEKIAAEGKALGYLPDERVVFVPFTAPGDVVDVRLGRRRKAYAEGVVERMVTPSTQRVEAPCPHFTICGGCKWQHIPYPTQTAAKEEQVYDQLERIGHLDISERRKIIGAAAAYRYRNKLEFTFSNKRWLTSDEIEVADSYGEADRLGLGFHIPGKFDKVLDIEQCLLMEDINDRVRLFVRDFCKEQGYPFFDLRTQEGLMRTLMIRTSSTGGLMVVVVFAYEDKPRRTKLLDALRDGFPEITSLMYVINEKRNDSLGDQEVLPYHGETFIWEKMEGLSFKVGPKSFYQTNSQQAYELYKAVRNFAGLTGEELVYDLYTGTGTIACFVAEKARRVIGIEYVEEAIEDARVNAEVNGLNHLSFFAGDMKEILTEAFVATHGRPDVIITDPPRAGMHEEVVQVIMNVAPERIVYVSCNPASQARDVALMKDKYKVVVAQPVDMFPQTHHVENILLLELK